MADQQDVSDPRGTAADQPGPGVPAAIGPQPGDIFRTAVQVTRMAMSFSDPHQPDNPLIFVNPAFVEQTGYSAEAAIGRNCRFLQGPATDPATVALIRKALAERTILATEIYNYRQDGSGFWNALYICPIFDAAGNLLHFFASQMDITKLREAELLQRQHLDAVGSMASNVANGVNNLLTVVVASVDQAARGAVGPRERAQLERAEAAARDAGRLTQQMLTFAQRQHLDRRAIDLNALVKALDGLLGQVVGERRIEFSLALNPLPAMVDAGQLELALIALVRNAADASEPAGLIVVGTRDYASWDSAEARAGQQWVELSVVDVGTGMPADVAERATEPFFSTKLKATGLGLSTVSGFVRQSGGRMAIETQPGRGTTVRLAFPKYAA